MSDDAPKKPAPPNMAWLLTFADLVSLLITFFVLLYSMKQVDESQWDEVKGALSGVFAEKEAIVVIHPDSFQSADALPQFPADSLPYLEQVLRIEFRKDPVLKQVNMQYDQIEDVLVLELPVSALFPTRSLKMRREGRIATIKLADKLRHLDNRIQIAGHADPRANLVRDAETPWEVGMQRALYVASIFHSRGMNQKIPAVSYGDSMFDELDPSLPLAERFKLSRRVEIKIYGDQGTI